MERTSKGKSSLSDSADRSRRNETRGGSSDAPSQSARDRNLIGLGHNPQKWSEKASTSRTSHSDQEKQALLHEEQELQERVQQEKELISRIQQGMIEGYRKHGGSARITAKDALNNIGKYYRQHGQYEEALFSHEIALALEKDSKTARKGCDICLAVIRAREAQHQGKAQGWHNRVQTEDALVARIE